MTLPKRVRHVIAEKLTTLSKGADIAAARWSVDRPKRPEHGDYATNAPMSVTKLLGRPPKEIAQELVESLKGDALIASAEVAGPGFVNLRLHPSALHEELGEIRDLGRGYGRK